MGGILYWLIVIAERIAGRFRRADDYSKMSYAEVTRRMRSMGKLSQQPGESLKEWNARIKPMMDVYHAWSAARRADPANYPPGEWAMRNYTYGRGDRNEALAELLAAGFADRAPNGDIVINKRGSDLEHQIRMYDR